MVGRQWAVGSGQWTVGTQEQWATQVGVSLGQEGQLARVIYLKERRRKLIGQGCSQKSG